MLTSNDNNPQMHYEFVCLDELVPEDHLLRVIQKHIDFSFIREKVRQYYCEDNGRPSIDPIVLFKMISLDTFTVSAQRGSSKKKSRLISPIVGFLAFL